MSPMPIVNQAYAMIISDESQKSVAATSGLLGDNPTIVAGHFDVAMYTKAGGNQRFKRNFNLYCDFCKMKCHNKENCYKIIGYPPNYKSKKKTGNSAAYNVLSEVNVQNNQMQPGYWTENALQNSQLTGNNVGYLTVASTPGHSV